MIVLVSLTELILYVCFSILFGSFIMYLIPEEKKPPIIIPKKVLYLATILIPVAAIFPVLRTVEILSSGMGLWLVLKNVLFTFVIGKAWVFITLISAILIRILVSKEFMKSRSLTLSALVLTFTMLLGYTWSSHAASITEWNGFITHTLHFLSVTIWIGILLIVSWFSKSRAHWMNFLRWFTPVAITCLIIAVVAGYFTMSIDINSYDDPNASILQEYQNSLIVNYGQALLIKHLFVISLILFALLNGVLFRKLHENDSFNPFKWARLESIYALIVFGVTAFMGQSWPPHQIYSLLKTSGASPLFTAVNGGDSISTITKADFNVTFHFGFESYLFFLLSLLFMITTILAAKKRQSLVASILSSLLMVLSAYYGLMVAVQ